MRIAFAGTPEFAAVALGHLVAEGFDVALVLTQPDRPAGRGQQLQASAVKKLAQQHGLSVAQPRGLRLDGRYADDAAAAQSALQAAKVDAMVVVAYGLILPPWLLQVPRLGCFNIHGSLLPRWRGAAPIHRAIEAGDTQTGITIIQMDEGLDTGDMLATQATPIGADDTMASVHDTLAAMGARLVAQVLRDAQAQRLRPQRQPTEGVCYASKIEKSEAAIDWSAPAVTIERRARAFDPFPGCHFMHEGEAVKLWRARVHQATGDEHGGGAIKHELGVPRLVAGRVLVDTGEGVLELLTVQRPGGRRITAAAWAAGWGR